MTSPVRRWARAIRRRLPRSKRTKQVIELRAQVAELRAHVAELRAHVDVVRATAAEGRRLGLAATRSIDVSLQAELLLRRDVDALADVGGGESTPS